MNRSGTHRAAAFVHHLDELGWRATVIAGGMDGEPVDPGLSGRIPSSTTVIRRTWEDPIRRLKSWIGRPATSRSRKRPGREDPCARAKGRRAARGVPLMRRLGDWVTRLLKTPDSRLTWVPAVVRAGLRVVATDRPSVLFSTSPCMSAHLAAGLIHVWTRIPWVADFRDPWTDNPYRDLRYPSLRGVDGILERWVLRKASAIVTTTPTMAASFAQRIPGTSEKIRIILNGTDFDVLEGVPPAAQRNARKLRFVHCGQFYGPRSPVPLFRALRRAVDAAPSVRRRVELVLVGPPTFQGMRLDRLAAQFGVDSWVKVLGPKTNRESLQAMTTAHATVLACGSGKGAQLQVPQKLFEYLAMRRPILAVVPNDNPAAEILRQARADAVICQPSDEASIARAIEKLCNPRRRAPRDAWAGVDAFDRRLRSRELAGLFNEVVGARGEGEAPAAPQLAGRLALPGVAGARSNLAAGPRHALRCRA